MFSILLFKLIPLYLIILLGVVLGKYLRIPTDVVGRILVYGVTPVVVFHGVLQADLASSTLLIPVIYFIIAIVLGYLFLEIGKKFWRDGTKNVLAYTAGTGNLGYFGIPVITALFGESALSINVLCIVGIVLYECTVGYYFIARGRYSSRESYLRLLKLPIFYAFTLGVLCNYFHFPQTPGYIEVVQKFLGTYNVLGMMLVGIGLARVTKAAFDLRFITLTFVAKFLMWPILTFAFLWIDAHTLQLLPQKIEGPLMVLSFVPLAANTVVFAAELKVEPEKAAVAVMLSTIAALFIIPIVAVLFASNG